MNLKTTLRRAPRQALAALRRTPLEVLLGAAAWVPIALAIEDAIPDDSAVRTAIAAAIALPLVYATSVLAATGTISRLIRWLTAAAAIAAAALYALLRFDPDLGAENWRAATLIAASSLALLAIPLIADGQESRRDRAFRFFARLAVRVAVVGAYALALYAGLAAAIGAVNGLFALDLPDRLYAHLAALVFVLLPPWAVAAGLPALAAPPSPWGTTTILVLRRTALFLLAPLIGVYLLIVYAYAVRMLVTGEVPSNLISPVVLGAGALTLAATLLVEPLHRQDDDVALTRFVRALPLALLPLTWLALWAVLIRVGQYGWTEFRYLRVLAILLLGAFALAGSWRLMRRRLPPLAALPPFVASALVIAAIGPLSAPAVSYRSQHARLAALIVTARGPRRVDAPAPVAPEVFADITSTARYLSDHFGEPALDPFLAPGAPEPEDRSNAAFAAMLGITEAIDDALPRVIHATLPENAGIPGIAGGTLYVVDYQPLTHPGAPQPTHPRPSPWPHPTPAPDSTRLRATLDSTGTRITIHPPDGPPLSAESAPLVHRVVQTTLAQTGDPIQTYDPDTRRLIVTAHSIQTELPAGEVALTLADPDGRPHGQIIFRRLTIRALAGSATIEGWGGLVIVH